MHWFMRWFMRRRSPRAGISIFAAQIHLTALCLGPQREEDGDISQ
jgi:hypothetical protein